MFSIKKNIYNKYHCKKIWYFCFLIFFRFQYCSIAFYIFIYFLLFFNMFYTPKFFITFLVFLVFTLLRSIPQSMLCSIFELISFTNLKNKNKIVFVLRMKRVLPSRSTVVMSRNICVNWKLFAAAQFAVAPNLVRKKLRYNARNAEPITKQVQVLFTNTDTCLGVSKR